MSAILSADDLNDFISPGVACIKPVETLPKEDDTSNPYEVTTEDKVQAQNPAPASISLTDCLACSGCVTSAEAVLVSLQSHTEVLNTLDSYPSIDLRQDADLSTIPANAKIFVASVSPQVRASMAATFGISERKAGHMIEQFLSGSQGLRAGGHHQSGFTYVVDTNRMREACLVLGADEVTAALEDKSKPKPILTSACPGWICYAEKTHPHVLPHLSALKSPQALNGTLFKSVLSKSLNIHPSQIWHLAIMPCFDKKLEASRAELTDKWWTQSDDSNSSPVRDVDCVITSRELLTLAEARGIQLAALPQTPVPSSERAPFVDRTISSFLFSSQLEGSKTPSAQSVDSGTSGGYLMHILKTHQSLHPGSTIVTTKGRNADVLEYTLVSSTNQQPLLRCARYYGFRNIQNLVRKLKPARQSRLPGAAISRRAAASSSGNFGSTDYAYVEVMACPGGCTNGGGQIKIEDVSRVIPQTRGEFVPENKLDSPLTQKEWLARIDEAYFSASSSDDDDYEEEEDDNVEMSDPDSSTNHDKSSEKIHQFLQYWSQSTQIPLDKLTLTSYRSVESDVGKLPSSDNNNTPATTTTTTTTNINTPSSVKIKTKVKKKEMSDTERIAAIAGLEGGGW